MRANKKAIIWTVIITVVSLIICLFQHSNHNLIYDLSLACFGSSLLGIVIAYTAYKAERRDAMEKFVEEVRNAIDVIRYIPAIEITDSFRDALEDEKRWLLGGKGIRHSISSRNESTTDKQIEEGIERPPFVLSYGRSVLRKGAAAYIAVGEFDLSGFNSAYGRLDFLIGNEKIRNAAYSNLYDKIRNFKLECLKYSKSFKIYIEEHKDYAISLEHFAVLRQYVFFPGDEDEFLEQMQSLQDQVFEIRDGFYYAKLRDELIHDLETFRSQIYNIKPEYEKSQPEYCTKIVDYRTLDKVDWINPRRPIDIDDIDRYDIDKYDGRDEKNNIQRMPN